MTVRIVCGPPCSGKSTYVEQHKQPGDLVIDYDVIARKLGSPRTHGHEYRYHKATQEVIDHALRLIESGKRPNAWVIRSLPRAEDRNALAKRLGAEVVLVDADDDVLMTRASERPDPGKTQQAIRQWREAAGPISPSA